MRNSAGAIALTWLCALPCGTALAQPDEPSDAAVDRAVERVLAFSIGEHEDEDLDELWWLREHPMDLLTASVKDLSALPGISYQDAINIVHAVHRLKPTTYRELDSTASLSDAHLALLRAFTTLDADAAGRRTEASVRIRLASRLERARGARDEMFRVLSRLDSIQGVVLRDTISVGHPYRGAPHSVLARVDLSRGAFSLRFTLESDRDEPLSVRDTAPLNYSRYEEVDLDTMGQVASKERFAGFVSGSCAYRTDALTLLAGDYTLGFGQGLIFGGAVGGPSSSSLIDRPVQPTFGLKAYRSTAESGFLRGVVGDVALIHRRSITATLSLFGSWRDLDATVETIADSDGRMHTTVASMSSDGLHRTVSEIRRSGAVLERIFGGSANVAGNGWSAGVVLMRGHQEIADARQKLEPWGAGSIYARAGDRHSTLYAELASDGEHLATIAGTSRSLGSTELVAVVASIPEAFNSPYAVPHPLSSLSPGEHMLSMAAQATHGDARGWCSVELVRRTSRSSTRPFPSWSAGGSLLLELHPTRALSVTSRVRTLYEPRTSHDTDRAGRDWVVAADESSLGIRIGIEFASEEPPLVVRAHVERRVIDRGPSRAGSSGLATYLSARLDPAPWITIGGFLALHSVTDADVAPSIAVSDLPGRTTSQRLYGEGRVLGLSARLRATEGMTLSASYVEVRRIDVDTLGSGLDALEGPLQRGVSVQIDIRLRAR